jgi:hypothetical protein
LLTVAYATTVGIEGMPEEQFLALTAEVYEALYSPDAVFTLAWRPGDLVIWDNRVVQHGRRAFALTQPRKLRRMITGDVASLVEQFQRWERQAKAEQKNAAKYAPGSVLSPGAPAVWFGMPAEQAVEP